MTVRATRNSVTFAAPFRLPGFDAPLPAGSYAVDTEEEAIEGNVRTVFHRIATNLVVETTGRVEHRAVDPQDLKTALRQHREAAALRTDEIGSTSCLETESKYLLILGEPVTLNKTTTKILQRRHN